MPATETKEMMDLIEVAALRIAQLQIGTKSEIKGLVNTLRRTFPDWLYVNADRATYELAERFNIR